MLFGLAIGVLPACAAVGRNRIGLGIGALVLTDPIVERFASQARPFQAVRFDPVDAIGKPAHDRLIAGAIRRRFSGTPRQVTGLTLLIVQCNN